MAASWDQPSTSTEIGKLLGRKGKASRSHKGFSLFRKASTFMPFRVYWQGTIRRADSLGLFSSSQPEGKVRRTVGRQGACATTNASRVEDARNT